LNANKNLNNIYKENDKVAVRFPHVKWLSDGLSEIDCPITATSANISDQPYTNNIEKIINIFKDSVPLYLYDVLYNLQPSTIVDISNENNITFIRNPNNLSLQDIIL
jgi:tRNA A37 threonylcarbamoyladenosine synthetase subunit TsaC/SUA5/YrdC